MKKVDWLKPGLKIKRWIFLGMAGMILLLISIYPIVKVWIKNNHNGWFSIHTLGIFIGGMIVFFAIQKGVLSIIHLLKIPNVGIKAEVYQQLYEKRILNKGPKVVAIGGGTGLSVLLRGLKKYTTNITAIVTVADDGGGSGVLREDLGMLPPGDIRNCILALANTEPIMQKLLQYRFKEGSLQGQSFGNLLIAAMDGMSDGFLEAIQKIHDVLAVTGRVLPVTIEDVTLYAQLKNGKIIKGESQIPKKACEMNSSIDKVFIKPSSVKSLKECIQEIMEADVVVLGPGSLYTSIIPNLLITDIQKALKKTKATKVYITNVMTQPGETNDYSVMDHVNTILQYLKGNDIDYIFVNNENISEEVLKKYKEDGAKPIMIQKEDIQKLYDKKIKVIEGPFVDIKKNYIRHDANKLSEMIIKTALREKYAVDKNKIIDYYVLMDHVDDLYRSKD